MITVDAIGLSCPEPVILTQNAIKAHPDEDVQVQVDNATARDNIIRMARGVKRTATAQEENGVFTVTLTQA